MQERASSVDRVKRDGGRTPTIVWVAALLCLVVAVGAALQGQFTFTGARWTPPGADGTVPKVTAHPQTPQPSPQPNAPVKHSEFIFNWVPILLAAAVLVLAVLVFLVWFWLRRRRRDGKPQRFSAVEANADEAEVAAEPAPDLPTLRRGLALATEVLGTEREPRDAIVRAWIGLQEAAEDSGMRRRSSETPTEFTSRVFAAVRADRHAADTLLSVYLRVRFGSRPATAEDVRIARDAVATLSATWPAGAAK
jgi:hypothetical protein